jgi:DTW domain-containing protein
MNTKRHLCNDCFRPEKTCLCKFIKQVDNHINVIILQHPTEARHAKNSAQLLHKCLKNSQLHVGEQFAAEFFNQSRTQAANHWPYLDVLLYPETPDDNLINQKVSATLRVEILSQPDNACRIRLWVLDGTWRKSRKMLYLNSALQQMPRLALQNCPRSIYSIRKSQGKNQLSTLEASCYALTQLEQGRVDYTPVHNAFADFIAAYKSYSQPLSLEHL